MAEYIEREAVIDTLYAAFKKYWKIPCSNVDMAVQRDVVHTKNKIYDIPAADVAPVVHGKWVYTHHMSSMPCVTGHVRCVVCDRIRPRLIGDILNFCPNCGADMRERKGDDAA